MFLKSWVQMGGFELTHYWHRIDVLVALECALIAMVGCLGLALLGRFVKRSRRLTILSLIGAVSFATAAWAANTALSALTAAGAISGTNLFYVVQTAGVGGVKATATQIATFMNSLFSGDATVTSGGAVTVLKMNGTTPPASAIFKGNGSGGIASAVSGTDYAPATSGSSPLFGNGAGGFSNGTKSGSTTLLMTGSGTFTSGHCPQFDANLNLVDSGAACGGGGGGTPGGTAGQVQFNNAGAFGGFTFSGDLSVNTATGVATLPTVNSNVGSFGSATLCVAITTNAKGLITAASAVTCTPAIASMTGLGTGVATALAIPPGTAGSFVVNGGAGGTPSSITLTNGTGLPVGSITGLGTGIPAWLANPSSANLAAAVTGETGSGALVFGTAPTISSLNAATAMTLAFLTGSTQCLQVNSSGAVSGTGAACGGSGSTGANPTATAGPTAINGTSPNFMRSDGAPAVQTATTSQLGLVEPDGATIKIASGVISAPPSFTSRTVTGTTDTILAADLGNTVFYNSALAVAVSQPAPSGSFGNSFGVNLCNINAGAVTVTPGSGLIYNGATLVIPAGSASKPSCAAYQSNGTNFNPLQVVPGAGVAAAMGNALSAAGGLTGVIASGTVTLGTSAIASGACATVVTVPATNVTTTDRIKTDYNSDPTSVGGYGVSSTGAVLTIYPYPTSGNVNFKVCNSTAASITPGAALTLNWDVQR